MSKIVRLHHRSSIAVLTAIALLVLVLPLTGMFLTRPVQAVSSTIVINQVYGGGGNAGATLKNDFIELFNRGNAAVSLNGWAVQYASATGTSWQVTALTNVTLQPGQYYLIQEAAGAGGTTGLPTPDATGNIAMALGAGKVALTNNTAGLSGTGCPFGASVVDYVGYGSTANCSEGGAPTATLTNTTAALRINAGCNETDNNSADFATGAPDPRNTNDDLHVCGGPSNPSGVGTANPNSVAAGASSLLTVAVTPGSTPPSTGITVTGDLSAIGGLAAQQFFDNATNGDVTAGDNTFSYQATVNAGTPGGIKSLPISIADAEARTGSANISLAVQAHDPAVAGAANPTAVAQGASVVLTATVVPGAAPPSTTLAVTGDLSSLGGSPTQQFFDDGITGGDTVAGNNVFTFTITVNPATTTGAKSLPLTVMDAQARSGSGTISVTVTTPPAPHDPAEHMVMGNPNGATADVNFPDNYLMMKLQYALSYNNSRRIPNWTSWHLDSTWRGSTSRQDDYRNDTTLPPGFYQVLGTDYSGSGFDRGHMCPSADRTSSIPDNSATFLMTNMVPQAPGNNQGPWAALENYLRTFLPGSEIYIVSGGTGTGGTGSGGFANTTASGVTVPAVTWKVALILPVGDNDVSRVDGNTRTIAVIMPNIDSIRSDQWQKYLATVAQVESLSGYDFFSNVPVSTQNVFEAKLDAANDTAPTTANQTKTTPEDQTLAVTLSATDSNVNNVFTYTIVAQPLHGSLSGSGGSLTYSPNLHYFGPDSFTFKANDCALDSNISTVNITVSAPTAAPAAINGVVSTANGSPLGGVVMRLSGQGQATTITHSDGTYRFENVGPNDFYTVTPALANYNFAPASRSFSLVANNTNAIFTANRNTVVSANPIDTTEYFVRQQYLDFLGREPDQEGFNYWSDQINSCLAEATVATGGSTTLDCLRSQRINVAAAFFIEREFQQSGSFIYDLYASALGRQPAFTEYSADKKQVVGGASLETGKATLALALVQRAEFLQKYQSNTTAESFVEALIQNVQQTCGVDLASQRESLIGRYNAATSQQEARSVVLSTVTESAAVRAANYNPAFVAAEYLGYLGRDPERDGYDFWLRVLNSEDRNNYRGMVCSFITSAEYQRRFSSVVTHGNGECFDPR